MARDFKGQRLGTILIAIGAIDEAGESTAATFARDTERPFGAACVELGLTGESAVVRALSLQAGTPSVSISDFRPDMELLGTIPAWLARKHRVLPLAHVPGPKGAPGKLVVACARPNDVAALDEIAFVTGCRVAAVVAADSDLERVLVDLYGTAPLDRRARVDLGRGPGIEHVVARYFR